jgi:KDO transferase-3
MITLAYQGARRFLLDGGLAIPLQEFPSKPCQQSPEAPLFLLASGASAMQFPFQKYARFPFIAMNGSVSALAQAGIDPLFYVVSDDGFCRNRPDLAALGLSVARHAAFSLGSYAVIHAKDPALLPGKSLYLLERADQLHGRPRQSPRRFAWQIRHDPDLLSGFSLFSHRKNRIGFSRNMQKGFFESRTVAYAALQLGYALGFRRIFIIGMDLKASTGRFYEKGQAAPQPSFIDQEFDSLILPSFRFMAEHALGKEGFQVYNLSQDSRLPASVVPKITLGELEEMLLGASLADGANENGGRLAA